MRMLGHALSRAGYALRCIGVARDDHGAGYARSIIRFADLYGRRLYPIAEIETQGLLNPEIPDGESLLIEGNVTWDPTFESAVGSEILRPIRADKATQRAVSSLQAAVSR